jgi:quercetin dioxygenase-like cupin family protein
MKSPMVDWSATPWTPVRPGVRRKAFSGEGCTLALHELMPGHEPRPHSHPYEQLVYVLSGEMDFHVGEVVHHLGTGGVIAIPPDVMHHAVVTGTLPGVSLDVFTPRRHEYA